jgi:transposase-like protein
MAGGERMTIEEVVRRVLGEEHGDVIGESVRVVAQELMEAEVSELVGAQRGERSEDRATHRNGYRPRRWDTRAGEIELQIPKIRRGQLLPELPAAQEAIRAGAGLRRAAGLRLWRVDAAGRSARRVARASHLALGGQPDRRAAGEQVRAFRERPLEGRCPYLFVDVKVEKVRDGGRVARKAVVIAHAVHENGRREIIGLDVGEAETESF